MPGRKWTEYEALSVASEYTTRQVFHENDCGAYTWLRRQGLLDQACLHMPRIKWTKELAFKEAKKYTTKAEFRAANDKVYHWLRYRDLVDEACSHMVSALEANNRDSMLRGSHNKSGVYLLWQGPIIVYVGKSKRLARRLEQHILDPLKVFNKITTYVISNIADMHITEVYLINKYSPIYNKECNNHGHCATIDIPDIYKVVDEEFTYNLDDKDDKDV